MKSYLRFLSRNKLYTAIELVGLSVALAFVLFIATFVVSELGYDKQLENTQNIYVASTKTYPLMSYTMGAMAQNSFPEIEATSSFIRLASIPGLQIEATIDNEKFSKDAFIVDRNFFDFFTFSFVEGDRATALQQSDAVVVSQSFASRYFPNKSALGQIVTINIDGKEADLYITGVIEDIKRSVFPQIEMFYGIQHLENFYPNLLRNGNGAAAIFHKIKEGTDVEELQNKIFEKAKEEDMLFKVGLYKEYLLSPFSQIHYGVCESQYPFVGRINLNFVLLFMAAGILLLLFAILNYISLTVAQVGFRAREMATRQLLGEQRLQIIWRYIKEALLLTTIALCISLLLAYTLQPYFDKLVGKEMDMMSNLSPSFVFMIAVVVLIISVLVGLVPALLVSQYKPVNVAKGEFATDTKMTLGKWFMFFQNGVAIITLCVSFAMLLQFMHLLEQDRGYDMDNILLISGGNSALTYFEQEIMAMPFVESVGFIQMSPVDGGRSTMGGNYKGEKFTFTTIMGDKSAFDILNFRVIDDFGKDLSGADLSSWLTEGAMAALDLDTGLENFTLPGLGCSVCGVIKDIQMGSNTLEECSKWNIIYVNIKRESAYASWYLNNMLVKVIGDENEAMRQINRFYESKGVGDKIYAVTHNQMHREYFTSEENNLELITIFTLLAIMLSSLAMLAMSTYFAKQNAKNYSIKKVFGYERSEIYFNMLGGFLKIVGIAAIVAIPIGYYVVGEWLSGYSYRISNYWWIYLLAVVVIAIVAVAVISWQAFKLMNSNPVVELKKE